MFVNDHEEVRSNEIKQKKALHSQARTANTLDRKLLLHANAASD